MKKSDISRLATSFGKSIKKRSPEILVGLGITGMVTAYVAVIKETPKALKLIEEKKEENGVDELSVRETVKTVAPCYIPSAAIVLVSIFCIVGASATNHKRNAALATAYAISESSFKEYKDKVIESIGEKKEQEVRESVAKEKLNKNPVREIILTDKGGNTKCFDVISGRCFESDRSTIDRAVNELNRRMRDEQYVTLNDFYYEIGLDEVKLGDKLGWNIDKGYIEIDYSSQLDANGTPCLVIDYLVSPVYDFW